MRERRAVERNLLGNGKTFVINHYPKLSLGLLIITLIVAWSTS